MTLAQISEFNQNLVSNNAYISDPLALPETLSQDALTKLVDSISATPTSDRFYTDGTKLTSEHYQKYSDMLNFSAIKAVNQMQYAMVLKRTSLRTFPTLDRVFKSGEDKDLDRFQESGLFPGDAVAVLHASSDNKWYLVRAYNYLAWVQQKDIAIGSRAEISAFTTNENAIVITGAKVFTNYIPGKPQVSQIQLDMGVKLPLVKSDEVPPQLYGQNTYAHYVVKLPTKALDGSLEFSLVSIPRNQDVSLGYLEFNKNNLVQQAFKFLGERYGWGHDYNGRDCTGFVGEIYKSFGIKMPRNSEQQGSSAYGVNTRFDKQASDSVKLKHLQDIQIGDLIYIPGHVMMYLGDDDGKPYVIHDVKGLVYLDENGQMYRGTLNGVSVTPLLPLQLSSKVSYLDKIYNIKRIRTGS